MDFKNIFMELAVSPTIFQCTVKLLHLKINDILGRVYKSSWGLIKLASTSSDELVTKRRDKPHHVIFCIQQNPLRRWEKSNLRLLSRKSIAGILAKGVLSWLAHEHHVSEKPALWIQHCFQKRGKDGAPSAKVSSLRKGNCFRKQVDSENLKFVIKYTLFEEIHNPNASMRDKNSPIYTLWCFQKWWNYSLYKLIDDALNEPNKF